MVGRTTRTSRRLGPERLDDLIHPRRRSHGLRLICSVLLLVAATIPIDRESVSPLERAVFEALNAAPEWLFPPLVVVMQLGNLLAVPLLALVALAVTRRLRLPLDLALSGTAAWLLARVIKVSVERGRPAALLDNVILRGEPAAGLGYVSGHTAVAVALATVAAAYLGRRGKVTVFVLAAVVGFSRVYVGAHLPLDVIGGAAMGWAIGSLVHFLVLPEVTGVDPDTES